MSEKDDLEASTTEPVQPKKGKKKAVAEPVESEDRINKILNSEIFTKIKRKYGASTPMRASDMKVLEMSRIPTGIFPLDRALGGGYPVGRVNVGFGPKSSSKTTTFLRTIGNAQKMCANCWDYAPCSCGSYREPVCVFFDVEGTFDSAWAKAHGVDTERLLLSVPDYGEQVFDIAEGMLRSGDVDVICIDSLAFLTPAKEIEESIEKDLMGVQARMIGKGVRKFTSAINAVGNETGRKPTLFLTNQIRMKLGVMFGNPETQPGGYAPGFAASTEVRFSQGKYEMDEESGRPVHVNINFRIEKNKTSGAKMEGEFRIVLTDTEVKKKGDIFDEHIVITEAERIGLLERKGNTWHCLGEEFTARSLVERRMLTDYNFSLKLRQATMKILLAI